MIHKCKNLTLMRWRGLPSLAWQQLIQLNYTCFIMAFVKLKDKYYFLLIKKCITLKSDIFLLKTFKNQTFILAVH